MSAYEYRVIVQRREVPSVRDKTLLHATRWQNLSIGPVVTARTDDTKIKVAEEIAVTMLWDEVRKDRRQAT